MSIITHVEFGKVIYLPLMSFIANDKLRLIFGGASTKGEYYEAFLLSLSHGGEHLLSCSCSDS